MYSGVEQGKGKSQTGIKEKLEQTQVEKKAHLSTVWLVGLSRDYEKK